MWHTHFFSKKNIAFIFFALSFSSPVTFAGDFNMAYVEVNSNTLENAGCYIRSDNHRPFFSAVSLFAANINGDAPNAPKLFFNPQVSAVLNSSQISHLKAKGIKVFITLLGNHQNAGWSCMSDETAAKQFANAIVSLVNKYQFDGVDIDDEYSTCDTNDYSMVMLAKAIKTHPGFKGKLLTKALDLNADNDYFETSYQGHHLADYLDYGWEMSYYDDDFDGRLAPYLANGMKPNQVMIGGWTVNSYPDPFTIGQHTAQKALAGTMVYDINTYSQNYLTEILKGQENISVEISENCLT